MMSKYEVLPSWEALKNETLLQDLAPNVSSGSGTCVRGTLLNGPFSWASHDRGLVEQMDLNIDVEHTAGESELVARFMSAYNNGKGVLLRGYEPWKFITLNQDKLGRITFVGSNLCL